MDTRQFAHSFRILMGTLLAAPVLILGGLSFLLASFPGGLLADPNPLLIVGVLAAGLGVHYLCDKVLYKVAPVPSGLTREQATERAIIENQTKTIARFTVSDAVFVVCVALAFVVPQGGFLLALTGFAVTEILLVLHVWPTEKIITRTENALEADGNKSYLREIYALDPWTGPAHMAPGMPIADEAPLVGFASPVATSTTVGAVVLTKPTNSACSCGADLPESAQFCPTCGSAVGAQ